VSRQEAMTYDGTVGKNVTPEAMTYD
jgi:hypothetical protein